jgi:hypothetical protein
MKEYYFKDLEGVRDSEVVFAYMEKSNPSGIGLVVEITYGFALGKRIIFCDEKQDKYFEFVRELCTDGDCCGKGICVKTLEEGIEILKKLISKGKIYLAGGFRSGWQDRVKTEFPQGNYLDPREWQ